MKGVSKIWLVLCFLLVTVLGTAQPMNGSYTIGPTIFHNYNKFSEAALDLKLRGVNGPVTFNVDSGRYIEQFVLTKINGASPSNTITFQSTSVDSSDVILSNDTFPKNSYVVKLINVSHTKFKRLTFKGNWSNDTIVQLLAGSEENEFSHNLFRTQNWNHISGNIELYLEKSSDNLITENSFVAGLYQFRSINCDSITVNRNYFEGLGHSVTCENGSILELKGNTFLDKEKRWNPAIRLKNCNGPIDISSSSFSSLLSSTPYIRIEECDGITNGFIIIRNNFISGKSSGGISISKTSGVRIVNNSFNAINHVRFEEGTGEIEIYNNIFSTIGGQFFSSWNTSLTKVSSENNVFYSESMDELYADIEGNKISLEKWQDSLKFDITSIVTNPLFYSDTDLHINNAVKLNNSGMILTSVIDDIDGETRSSIAPDIGADEYDIDSTNFNDLQLVTVLRPDTFSCAKPDSLIIQVYNHSQHNIDSFRVKWSIYGFLNDSSMYVQVLPAHDTSIVNLGQYKFNDNTTYEFSFVIDKPNGQIDNNMDDNDSSVDYMFLGAAKIYQNEKTECSNEVNLYLKEFPRKSITWSTGSTQSKILNVSTGTYSVSVMDDKGCVVNDSIEIK